jgi:6-phosphogluconolactonase
VSAPSGTVHIVDDVARAFADTVLDAYRTRPGARFVLVLSGGPTARRCYEHLALSADDVVDWNVVDVLMGDERCVPADDPDANQRLVREALLERVAPVGSFHPMSCDDIDGYRRTVAPFGMFDVVHLGLGPDGHTASLFPGSPALDAPAGELVIATRDPNERNPHDRMSLTLEAIARARLAVFTVSGPDKHDAWAAVSAGSDLPAARVRAGEVVWLVDGAAAGTA